MRQKAEYKSAIRSRKLIRQAFVELMKEKDPTRITVTDVVKRAEINRGTFYAHYAYTWAVIEEIETEIITTMLEFMGEFRYQNFFQNPLPLLLKITRYLEGDLDYYRILINARGADLFLAKLRDSFVRHMETDTDVPDDLKRSAAFPIRCHFFAGGLVNLYQVWFRGDLDVPLNDIALEVSRVIAGTATTFLTSKPAKTS